MVRTWSGLVELVVGDDEVQVHADLAAEQREGNEIWWGQLRGVAGYDLAAQRQLSLRLPNGRRAAIEHCAMDAHDVYHRAEISGVGEPPF